MKLWLLAAVQLSKPSLTTRQGSADISWDVRDSKTVNWDDWCTVCDDPSDLTMDPGFLTALDDSMAGVAEIKYLIGYDRKREPVACVCVSTFLVDGGILTGPWHRPGTNFIRKLFPRYLMFRMLFCGLPVSIGCNSLRMTEGCKKELVVDSLSKKIDHLAEEQRTFLIVWKEFLEDECSSLQGLRSRGYIQADSLPMNTFDCEHRDFDEFCGALRSHYRYKIKRSRKKFERSGLRVEHITDPDRIEELYTPEVHQLYLAVLDHAQARLETLPREFFLNLTLALPGQVSFTSVFKDQKVVAFAWGVLMGDYYRNIFVGLDYSLNQQTDLYFNMMMGDLDYGMKSGASRIFLGQSADDFKSRLGSVQQPLSIFVKTRSQTLNWLASKVSRILIPKSKKVQPRNLLKPEIKQPDPAEVRV